jgi:hypothetical protein
MLQRSVAIHCSRGVASVQFAKAASDLSRRTSIPCSASCWRPASALSAGWGIFFNLTVALIVSAITQDDMDRKMEFHNFLAQHASLPPDRRRLIPTVSLAEDIAETERERQRAAT